jgi:hypothetical protein
MEGNDADSLGFVDRLIEIALRGGSVEGRIRNRAVLELSAGGVATTLSTDGAIAKFRNVCARLAVVFGGAARDPPVLYGGTLLQSFPVENGVVQLELVFKNTADGWFRIVRKG